MPNDPETKSLTRPSQAQEPQKNHVVTNRYDDSRYDRRVDILPTQEEPCRCLSSRWPYLGPTATNLSATWNKESKLTRPTRNLVMASFAPQPLERGPAN